MDERMGGRRWRSPRPSVFIWGRVDIHKERSEREASDARSQAMAQTMERMTQAVETMASNSSTPAQVRDAAAQARNAIRWRIRKGDRASDRVVYELTNAGSDVPQASQ